MKFTNYSEKMTLPRNPNLIIPINKHFYTTLGQLSHENLLMIYEKENFRSNLNFNKIIENCLKEIYTNLKEKFPQAMFDSQISTEISFKFKKTSEKVFDSFSNYLANEENETDDPKSKQSGGKLKAMKSQKLVKTLSDKFLRYNFNSLAPVDSKKKDRRNSVLSELENKNKLEGISNSIIDDEKNLFNKNKKLMEKNLKVKFHSNSNVIKENDKKHQSDANFSLMKMELKNSSDSESYSDREEVLKKKKENFPKIKTKSEDNVSNAVQMDSNKILKSAQSGYKINKSDTEQSNKIKISKLSKKKSDVKNNDCYIINNNIYVVDSKVMLKNTENMQESLQGGKFKLESTRKLEDKTSNIKVNKITNTPSPKSSFNKNQRCDRKGIPIIKGSKKHRVSFCDIGEKSRPLIEVRPVDSYKKMNILNTHGENSDRSGGCCLII